MTAVVSSSAMMRFRRAWNFFWCRQASPHALAVFRIGFGAFQLLYWGLRLSHVAMLYSRDGILLPLFPPNVLFGIFAPPAAVARAILCVLLFAIFFLTIGYRARLAAAIAFLLYVYYWCLSLYQLGSSFDRIFLFIFFVLACSGCDRAFSLSMYLRHGSFWAWEKVSILPQRLLAIQITATYLGVGWQKLLLPDWQSGTVISYGFVGRWATPLARPIALWNLPFWVFDWLNTIIKCFELTLPFGLWHRRTRLWYMAGGFVFHTMITLLLGIWWFEVLIPAYVVFFSPEETLLFLRRLSGGRIPAEPAQTLVSAV